MVNGTTFKQSSWRAGWWRVSAAAFETFRRRRRLADDCAAVDSDDLTRYVAGVIGEQRGDGRTDFIGLSNSAHRPLTQLGQVPPRRTTWHDSTPPNKLGLRTSRGGSQIVPAVAGGPACDLGTNWGPHVMRDGERSARLCTSYTPADRPHARGDQRKCVTAI